MGGEVAQERRRVEVLEGGEHDGGDLAGCNLTGAEVENFAFDRVGNGIGGGCGGRLPTQRRDHASV